MGILVPVGLATGIVVGEPGADLVSKGQLRLAEGQVHRFSLSALVSSGTETFTE
jgi:hypothetical protein